MKNVYLKNTPLGQAQEKWLDKLHQIGFIGSCSTRTVSVDDSLGLYTAAPVFAKHSSPPYNGSAMDGIAVTFSDLAQASEANPIILGPDRYLQVNTGNAIPEGFDAVVMIEDVQMLPEGKVEFIAPATPWQHIRTIGEDIVATELIVPEAHKIRPIDQGAMLATGTIEVAVKIPPKALVIPTGSELIQPGTQPSPGQIIEFNSRILGGYLTEWGATATRGNAVTDDPELLKKAIHDGVGKHDMIIMNAGASAGTKDFTGEVLAELGEVVVHGIAIKPGKPAILALVDGTPVIGLPGYPVSALLTMRLFVKEMISLFLGIQTPAAPGMTATMSRPVHSVMGVDEIIRVTLGRVGNNLMCTPSGKGAGAVMSMVKADGLLTIPSGSEGVGAGESVYVELLKEKADIQSTIVVIGSHDNIIDVIANQLHTQRPLVKISSAHVGSMGGIMAIKRGEAHIAGTHLLDETSGEYNISFIKNLLKDTPLQLINLCYREQGFIVPKGNPKNITSFRDIAENQFSFINRQRGAGTRLLTDKILADSKIASNAIIGYNHEEYTHMSVAAAVASGSVDTGMGIRAAAVALGLDFIPITKERYDFIIPAEFLDDPKIIKLLDLLHTDKALHNKIQAMGGYDLKDCGKVMYQQ